MSGECFSVGGGHVARVSLAVNEGYLDRDATIESIADHLDEVLSGPDHRGHPAASPVMRSMLQGFAGPQTERPVAFGAMPTAHLNGIDVYYERLGRGTPPAVLQRLGAEPRHQPPPRRGVRRAVRHRRPRPAGPRAHRGPARPVHHGRLRRRRPGPRRPPRTGTRSVSSASASAAWWPRSWPSPHPSGSSVWRCCAPHPAVTAEPATRCTSWPTSRPTNAPARPCR